MDQPNRIMIGSELALTLISVLKIYLNEKLGCRPSEHHMRAVLLLTPEQVMAVLMRHEGVGVALTELSQVTANRHGKFIRSVFSLALTRFSCNQVPAGSDAVLAMAHQREIAVLFAGN